MSRENVEVVRRGFEAWNVGAMDGLRDLHDPGVIMRPPKGWPLEIEPAKRRRGAAAGSREA
jgi:hypothetical protein